MDRIGLFVCHDWEIELYQQLGDNERRTEEGHRKALEASREGGKSGSDR